MHQNESKVSSRRRAWRGASPALALLFAVGVACAEDQPSAAMMAPVNDLVTFMSTLPAGKHATAFAARGVCIVENFAPFLFCGPRAAARWEAGFRAHADGLAQLSAQFDAAHDFSEADGRAYFSLPTTWTGLDKGRHFEEHGAWSFVLQRQNPAHEPAQWRIVGYGWGVTAFNED